MKKYILGLVVILLAAGGIYVVKFGNWGKGGETASTSNSAVADAPVGWQTYRDEQYGFSFQYPESWKQSNIFDSSYHPLGGKEQIVFVKSSEEEQMKNAIRPDSDNSAVINLDRTIFIEPASRIRIDAVVKREVGYGFKVSRIKTSSEWFVDRILGRNDFVGGASYEIYIYRNKIGDGAIFLAEYSTSVPSGELKSIMEKVADP